MLAEGRQNQNRVINVSWGGGEGVIEGTLPGWHARGKEWGVTKGKKNGTWPNWFHCERTTINGN